MKIRPLSAFLLSLAGVVLLLASVAVVQSRLDTTPYIALDGNWDIHHLVQWGPYKTWSFHYRLSLREQRGRLYGEGVTLLVNGDRPGAREQTTLQVVDGVRERGQIIAWVFERNGDRAGRGAIKWRVVDANRLVGTFATTFYRGASVAQRVVADAVDANGRSD
ncbi:hypothetical protein [Halochromatium roseum]|uniref:hypothetical protein n=1 Tax=Halochromatium roseum TaxID=391920 RepID=UPI001912AEA3|nr:hypothetical protein [Halochromatium roseum]MBK5938648.1 hypothetical protein [Halochromatium roseum]